MASKAVFVDRDDTLAKDVPYCDDPSKFNVYPDVPAAIARLNAAGFLVIVITNQSGIGRGYFDEETLGRVHAKMLSQISAGGGRVDDIFFCPHTPGDHCGCRKPEIGLGLRAVEKYGIDVSQSYMVGDADKDIEFGERLGCRRSIRVGVGVSFSDAVDTILRDL
jgi:histidinol-phosphate phosphatase family protein